MRMMHLNVGCSDFDRSYDFYTQVVGMKPVTGKVAKTGQDVAPDDVSKPRENGKRIGEHVTDGPWAEAGARVLGISDRGTAHNRGVLLYWDEQPSGPYIDLQQFLDVPGERVERQMNDHGIGRVAMFVDKLEPHLERLRAHDVELVSAPQEVLVGTTRLGVVCFYDPDGTVLEYVEMLDGDWTV
jgi:catechol 2,3-dioxygenase-like lactoylglutathione lyase family enzyme